jgi:hypothetical protein
MWCVTRLFDSGALDPGPLFQIDLHGEQLDILNRVEQQSKALREQMEKVGLGDGSNLEVQATTPWIM